MPIKLSFYQKVQNIFNFDIVANKVFFKDFILFKMFY